MLVVLVLDSEAEFISSYVRLRLLSGVVCAVRERSLCPLLQSMLSPENRVLLKDSIRVAIRSITSMSSDTQMLLSLTI